MNVLVEDRVEVDIVVVHALEEIVQIVEDILVLIYMVDIVGQFHIKFYIEDTVEVSVEVMLQVIKFQGVDITQVYMNDEDMLNKVMQKDFYGQDMIKGWWLYKKSYNYRKEDELYKRQW